MKAKVSYNKQVIYVKNKSLLQKLAEIFNNPVVNITLDNSIAEDFNFNKTVSPENSDAKTRQNKTVNEKEREKEKDINYSENILSIFRFIAAGKEMIISPDNKTGIAAGFVNQDSTINNPADNTDKHSHKSERGSSNTMLKGTSSFDELINSMDKKILSFSESAGNSFKKMWDGLIANGRKAKDPWDAVWLSLSNSAVKQIGEIINSELFSGLFRQIAGGGSSKSLLGSIISGIAGFFSGGILSKPGTGVLTPGENSVINTFNNYSPSYYSNRELVNTFSKYAEAAEKWQKELRVVNDLFENNRGIKTVQEYLNKIKS